MDMTCAGVREYHPAGWFRPSSTVARIRPPSTFEPTDVADVRTKGALIIGAMTNDHQPRLSIVPADCFDDRRQR
eukprot:214511-Prorocentrum_minimum.AAC.1